MTKDPFEKIDDGTYFLKSNPALFEATLDCFSSLAFESASLNDILKVSRFNKGSFYYRFPDKKSLYFALLDDLFLRQEHLFSTQRATLVEVGGLRGWTEAVFQNSLLLFREDPRYPALLERAYGEGPEFVAQIRSRCVSSLHDRFVKFVAGEAGPGSEYLSAFLGAVHLRLPAVLGKDFEEAGIARLVRDLFEGIEGHADEPVSAFPARTFPSSGTEGDLRLANAEILALAGSRESREAVLKSLLENDPFAENGKIARLRPDRDVLDPSGGTVGPFSDTPPLTGRLTLRQNLRQILRRNPGISEATTEELLGVLSLSTAAERKVSSLAPMDKRKADLLPAVLASSRILVAIDPFEGFPEEERGEICNLLLKCRAGGSTIILSTSRMAEILAVAYRVAFLREGTVAAVEDVRNLREKYRGKWILVEYREGNLKHRKAFPESRLRSPEFLDLLSTKTLLSVRTKDVLDEEIFHLETGVEIG